MKNYKIKVTPETSAEVQELFFELGYSWRVGGNKVRCYLDMKFIYIEDGVIFYKSSSECVGFDYQEITLPQLRDLVVLERNNVLDATHKDDINGKYYVGCYVYVWQVTSWTRALLDKSEVDMVRLTPITKDVEMTWEDALRAVVDGNDIDMRFNDEFEPLINLLEAWLYGKEFRLKPQTIKLNGEHTKEEWLKILGGLSDE